MLLQVFGGPLSLQPSFKEVLKVICPNVRLEASLCDSVEPFLFCLEAFDTGTLLPETPGMYQLPQVLLSCMKEFSARRIICRSFEVLASLEYLPN